MLSFLKEVKTSLDRKMRKLLTLDKLYPHYDTLAKTRSRMTTATTFSRQNDAASRASTTYYWKTLVLVVVLVLEAKGLYCLQTPK